MYIAEWPGTHKESGEPFTIWYELLPVSVWHRRFPLTFNKPWLVECIVDIKGSTYHHYKHDFWAWTLRDALRKAYDTDNVWWEVINSPTEEWW